MHGGPPPSELPLRDFYANAYASAEDQLVVWRRLGARMKVNSILRLTDHDQLLQVVAEAARLPIADVLEIGAGTGAILEALSDRRPTWNLTAVDIADASIATIRKLDLPSVKDASVADAEHLPFRAKQFDLAILSHVIEHLPNPVVALREAHRVAHLVVIEVPVEGTPVLNAVWFIRKLRGRQRIPNDLGHLRHHSVGRWNGLFSAAGLRIVLRTQYLLSREALVFGKSGWQLRLARLRAAGQAVLGERVWGNLVYSHYAVLAV